MNLDTALFVAPRDPADYAFNTLTADEDVAMPLSGWDQIMAGQKMRDQASVILTSAPGATHQTGGQEEDDDNDEHRPTSTEPGHKRGDLQHGFLKQPILCTLPEWVAVTDDFLERAVLGAVDFMLGVNQSRTRLNAKGRFVHVDVNGEQW